jgi:hypothetical protein
MHFNMALTMTKLSTNLKSKKKLDSSTKYNTIKFCNFENLNVNRQTLKITSGLKGSQPNTSAGTHQLVHKMNFRVSPHYPLSFPSPLQEGSCV